MPSRESDQERRDNQAVEVVSECSGYVAVEQVRERTHCTAAWAESEQAAVQAERRQALDQLNRNQSQGGKNGKQDQAENKSSGPGTVCRS